MDQYKDFKIKCWCFDTKVYNEQDFSQDSGEELTDYKLMGGGGTEFMCNWEYMKENDIQSYKIYYVYRWISWGQWVKKIIVIQYL